MVGFSFPCSILAMGPGEPKYKRRGKICFLLSSPPSLLIATCEYWEWVLHEIRTQLANWCVTNFLATANAAVAFVGFQRRASFWGDAYTVRKWTRNLRTKIRKCVPTKRNRETNAALHVLFETCWDRVAFYFAYTVCIISVVLRTARFLCVLYAYICVNATAAVSMELCGRCYMVYS